MKLAKKQLPDIIILDLGLPGMDGFEVLRQIRSFSAGEFLARVKAALRHSQTPAKTIKVGEKFFINGSLRIDFASRQVSVDDKPIRLTRSEFDLLYQLVTNEGKVLSVPGAPGQGLGARAHG